MKSSAMIVSSAVILFALAGCQIKERKDDEGNKNVTITTGLGSLKARDSGVDPAATGFSVYPNSTLKPKTQHDEGQADVNIDTPWFGVKVVAVTYTNNDSPEKIWEYYKKEIASRYGKPLECRPGSPDLKKEKENSDDLSCWDKNNKEHNRNIKLEVSEDNWQLKSGTERRQRIVSIKPKGDGTEFALVYVVTRGGREGI